MNLDLKNNTPTIVVAGANAGIELFLLVKKFPNAKIVAYEADAELVDLLRKNIQLNKIENIELMEAAVWISNGKIPFESDGGLGGKIGAQGKDVRAVDFKEELAKFKKIDALFMDIEGAENQVLLHLGEQLKMVENLFVEWHGRASETQNLQDLLNYINSNGFRYRIDNKLPDSPFVNGLIENGFDAMTGIYATRPANE